MIRPDSIAEAYAWCTKQIAEGLTFKDAGLRVDIHPDSFDVVSTPFREEPFTGPTGRIRIRNRQMNIDSNPPGALFHAGLSARQRELVKAELETTAECAFLLGVRAVLEASS